MTMATGSPIAIAQSNAATNATSSNGTNVNTLNQPQTIALPANGLGNGIFMVRFWILTK